MVGRHYKNNTFVPNPDRYRRRPDEGVIWFNDIPVLMAEIPKRVRKMGIEEAMDWFYKNDYLGEIAQKRPTVWHHMCEVDSEGYRTFKVDFSLKGSGSQEIGDMVDVAWTKLRDWSDYCTWLYRRGGFTEAHRAQIVKLTNDVDMISKLSKP